MNGLKDHGLTNFLCLKIRRIKGLLDRYKINVRLLFGMTNKIT